LEANRSVPGLATRGEIQKLDGTIWNAEHCSVRTQIERMRAEECSALYLQDCAII